MRTRVLLAAVALSCVTLDAAPPSTVVVELFTSEGCSSCPPADALLQQLSRTGSNDTRVIALGEHVDYWDRQGWKDRFSSRLFTQRQEVYAAHFANESIYTPQLVVDGRAEMVGSDAAAARRAIAQAAASAHGTLVVTAVDTNGRVDVGVRVSGLPARHQPADIVVAIAEDDLSSNVTRGENRGRVLTHAAVVRQLLTIGEASGETAEAQHELTLGSDWAPQHITVAAFVQERRSRSVLASSAVPLVPRP